MSKPRISIIAALGARNRAIGKAGGLLWRIPGDLPRFKTLTMGHPIIMGRKTYESIGRVLPGRTNVVLTQSAKYKRQSLGAECMIVGSLEEALETARRSEGSDEIFIIGGGEIYKIALPLADRLYLTLVDDDAEGDVFFPPYPYFQKIILDENHGDENPPFRFLILER